MVKEYYNAAHSGAALVEKDWLGVVRLTGSERVSWLQGMVSNDVGKLRSGEGCYAAHLTPQGKIVAHMTVLADEDALLLVLERSTVVSLVAAFDKLLIMEDVQVTDMSADVEILGLVGPKSASVLEAWLGEPVGLGAIFSHRIVGGYRVVRSEIATDVWVTPQHADDALHALAGKGASAIDHGTWDVLRTESGLPVYGVDIDETTTLPEIGERAIDYGKGCYVGQEVVAKVKYIGHVNRKFVGLVIEGADLPETMSPVRRGDKEVGYITTSLLSPGLGRPIALGFVSRVASSPGTDVEIVSEGQGIRARVVDLPFDLSGPK